MQLQKWKSDSLLVGYKKRHGCLVKALLGMMSVGVYISVMVILLCDLMSLRLSLEYTVGRASQASMAYESS